MYYTNLPHTTIYTSLIDYKNIHTYADDDTFLKKLDEHGYLYIENSNLLVIQDHKHIAKLFAEGIVQTDHIKTMLKSATICNLDKNKKKSAPITKHILLRILIDPHKGINDTITKKLRAVGDPDTRFTEDALRIIRGIRFVNVLNEKLK